MKESKRIKKVFNDLYNGHPWLDVTLAGTLQNISAAQAARKIVPSINSIWEITNHIISWRKNVLERVKGEVIKTPEHNYFNEVTDTSAEAWQQTLLALEGSQQQWVVFLHDLKKNKFELAYAKSGHNYYDLIQGIIQHDAYHLGQIVLLAKHFTTSH